MSSLKGGNQLRARLKALRLAFKPAGRAWADETVRQMRPRVPIKSGRLRKSFRRRNANQKRATVVGHFSAYFIDAGVVPHTIKAKRAPRLVFQSGGRTIFARKVNHRGFRARPFRQRAAEEALRREPMAQHVIDQWNKAA
jgi:hypothetical protein